MRDDYLKGALAVITDPNILVNVVSRRVKQLRRGHRALVESLEKLSAEDTALREIIEGRISYELPTREEMAVTQAARSAQSIEGLREYQPFNNRPHFQSSTNSSQHLWRT